MSVYRGILNGLLALALLLALLAGCAELPQNSESLPSITPPPADDPAMMAHSNPGSIYNPGNADYLFSDNRARRVGDIVIINISEVSSGQHEANTDTKRNSEMDISVTSFFGKEDQGIDPVGGFNIFGLNTGTGNGAETSTYNKFKGEGSTDRNSSVSATVAARVIKILPGGLLQVEGAREVRVNDETQILVIKGLVRPRDISPSNTVDSSYLADSKIEYYGKGVLADKQKAGWVMRLLDNVWPF